MDGHRFDILAQSMAERPTRRAFLRVVGGGGIAAVLALLGRGASAKRGDDPKPKPVCPCPPGESCAGGGCCPSPQVCGDLCCPPEIVGCVSVPAPGGGEETIGCLCPQRMRWDRDENVCVPKPAVDNGHDIGTICSTCEECGSDNCCGGICCGEDEVCCGGTCSKWEDCICPPGTACSGSVTCTSFGHVVTTVGGVCCSYPTAAFCCTDSAPGAGDGAIGCCTPGVDCPIDTGVCQGLTSAQGGRTFACSRDEIGQCGLDEDCCFDAQNLDEIQNISTEQNCLGHGKRCDEEWPCCGKCVEGVCTCAEKGDLCRLDNHYSGYACCPGRRCVPTHIPNEGVCL